MNVKAILKRTLLGVLILLLAFSVFVWFSTYSPAEVEKEAVTCPQDAPALQPGQTLKVLTWNVQFMAGKKYTFWFDVPNNDGPDERPTSGDVTKTLKEVARVIQDEKPDIVYLQEVDKGSARTDLRDELAELLAMVPDYICHTQAFYWKSGFIPHPRVHGSVGLSLATLSKYRIEDATRYQLPIPPGDPLTQHLSPKRAILDSRIPVNGAADFHAINTHLDAFAQGNNTMELQVERVDEMLAGLNKSGNAWVIGGDFNLLPPDDPSYERLAVSHQSYYNPDSEINLLYSRYDVIPGLEDVTGADFATWFTYLPNDPEIPFLDRTLDYLFYASTLTLEEKYVRSEDTQSISDHMPVIGVFTLP